MDLRINRRRLIWGLIVLALIALIAYSLRPRPLEVDVAVVTVGPLDVVVQEDGRTRTVNRFQITAPIAGRMDRIASLEGDSVSAGQILARIYPVPLDERARAQIQAQLAAAIARESVAQSNVLQARAASDQAARELERRRALAADGILTTEVLEQYELAATARADEAEAAERALQAASAEVAAARAALIEAGANDGSGSGAAVSVRAPASGTVLRIPERSARIVGLGEPLFEIGDASKLEIVVDVLSSDAARIRPLMDARVDGWGGPALDACVARVEPAAFTRVSALGVEEQRVNVVLDLVAAPPPGLGDGYRVQASITIWQADSVTTAPAAALFRVGEGWHTFVVVDGTVQGRDVVVGHRGGTSVEILDGLQPGDHVITFPDDDLEDGARVRERLADGT